MKILMTGGTGLIGKELLKRFPQVTVVSRNRSRTLSQLGDQTAEIIEWDFQSGPLPAAGPMAFDVVINLMGEPIADGRWTAARKQRIRDSRVIGTRHLRQSMERWQSPPRVLISASAVGYYGDRGDEWLDEDSSPDHGFLGQLAQDWEAEALATAAWGVRVVLLRTGIVLARGGGALAKMLPAYRWGAGARLGQGRQWMPWIHLHDLVELVVWASENHNVVGPLNGVAPNPVTNAEFHRQVAIVLRMPAFLSVPEWALRLLVGEFAGALLDSQRVRPAKALELGFEFRFPELVEALRDLLEVVP